MAPRGKRAGGGGGSSVGSVEPQAFHELGVRGRKTGTFLRDTGERDEHGMQPLEDIFSSPQKRNDEDDGAGGSEDMDISSSGGPGPRTLLQTQRTMQNTAAPRSSPSENSNSNDDTSVSRKLDFSGRGSGGIGAGAGAGATGKAKANGKPAASNGKGSLGLGRDDSEDLEAAMVQTREDDLMLDPEEMASAMIEIEVKDREEAKVPAKKGRGRPPKTASNPAPKTVPKPASKPAQKAPIKVASKVKEAKPAAKPAARTAKRPAFSPEPEELEASEAPEVLKTVEVEVEVQEAEEQRVVEHEREQGGEQGPPKKRRGRPPTKATQPPQKAVPEEQQPSKKRRSIEEAFLEEAEATGAPSPPERVDESPRKKRRTSPPPAPASAPAPAPAVEPPKPRRGRGRPQAAASAPAAGAAKPMGRGRPGRKPKASSSLAAAAQASKGDDAESSFAGLRRGPPMPKSRGLVSVRKDGIMQTRSGRHSYKPIDYWRGEQAVLVEEEQDDMFHRNTGFVMPKIKEVVRVPLEDPAASKSGGGGGGGATSGGRGGKSRPKPKKAEPEEPQPEEWEVGRGVIEGEIVLWEPEHEEHPPADDEAVQVTDERIALSAGAIETADIRDATFRFAKTLTMPFMGAGVVDLPAGGEKRPKNSRKMHMVFFVHTGKVMVTINETQFRISAGGMWFVPRGNYYSITNDYDHPSRVFFCQACEVNTPLTDLTLQSLA